MAKDSRAGGKARSCTVGGRMLDMGTQTVRPSLSVMRHDLVARRPWTLMSGARSCQAQQLAGTELACVLSPLHMAHTICRARAHAGSSGCGDLLCAASVAAWCACAGASTSL